MEEYANVPHAHGSADQPEATPDLRQRRRTAMQREIGLRAAQLFEQQGFADTTVDQIAAEAGISLRTFYRHCPVKEETLTPLLVEGVHALVDALSRRPSTEPLPEAARAALLAGSTTSDETLRIARVMLAEPALKARWLAAGRRAQDLLGPVVAERLGLAPDSLAAKATAGMLINVATTALEHWAQHPEGTTLGETTAAAYTAVAGFSRPGPTR